ncbi:MAG: hypothetical protein AB7U75_03165 [Hyphomicrobiaceae bacterium]
MPRKSMQQLCDNGMHQDVVHAAQKYAAALRQRHAQREDLNCQQQI